MRTHRFVCVCLLLCLGASPATAQPNNAKDCAPVLSKDYYSYAMKNNLIEDYVRSIDSETWSEMKRDNKFDSSGFFSGGFFSISDDYSAFDSKRTKYLDNQHYSRNQQQALDILKITTSDRAYVAYESCLRTVSSGVTVWASHANMDTIDLRVRYANPAGNKGMRLVGTVSGGTVAGAPRGHLWREGSAAGRWTVNQEKHFAVVAQRGNPETTVTVWSEDGASPVSVTFTRADGLLALSYVGQTDILRIKDRAHSEHTPDNNERKDDGCARQMGKHDAYCNSRTTTTITTTAPDFMTNPRPSCSGQGCPWSSVSVQPSVSPDGLSASYSRDNWGRDVDSILTADEYEHVSAKQCGGDGPIPVINGQAVLFTVPVDCASIATIQWTLLPDKSTGALTFGSGAPEKGVVLDGAIIKSGTSQLGSYKLTASPLVKPSVQTFQ